jgi:hypothetical protein
MGEAEAAGDGCGSGSELEPATPLAGYFRPSFRRSRLVALCRPFRFPQGQIMGPPGELGLRVTERYWANSDRQCSITLPGGADATNRPRRKRVSSIYLAGFWKSRSPTFRVAGPRGPPGSSGARFRTVRTTPSAACRPSMSFSHNRLEQPTLLTGQLLQENLRARNAARFLPHQAASPARLPGGHFTCYSLMRTNHMLPTTPDDPIPNA